MLPPLCVVVTDKHGHKFKQSSPAAFKFFVRVAVALVLLMFSFCHVAVDLALRE
jgi:hypothetical protein